MSGGGPLEQVMKRSTDNGHSWSETSVVHGESNPDTCTKTKHSGCVVIGNPAPIVDMSTGTVHMVFSRNNEQVGILSSTDEGLTWGAVRNLKGTLMTRNKWTTVFTGLSAGFTLDPSFGRGNRLIVCCNHQGCNPQGKPLIKNASYM